MKLKIVAIGNSRGVRLPKPLLEQAGIEGDVEVEVDGNALVLRAVKKGPRKGWEKAFQVMSERGDDGLLDSKSVASAWDQEEWEWK
jgi:antitoxin MazE